MPRGVVVIPQWARRLATEIVPVETLTIAYVTDLIFSTKITSTAQALGAKVRVVRNPDTLRVRLAESPAAAVIIDLNADGDPIEAVRATREVEPPPHTIAYLSHVQTELAEAAREAGADEVLPRSAFVERLPGLFGSADRQA